MSTSTPAILDKARKGMVRAHTRRVDGKSVFVPAHRRVDHGTLPRATSRFNPRMAYTVDQLTEKHGLEHDRFAMRDKDDKALLVRRFGGGKRHGFAVHDEHGKHIASMNVHAGDAGARVTSGWTEDGHGDRGVHEALLRRLVAAHGTVESPTTMHHRLHRAFGNMGADGGHELGTAKSDGGGVRYTLKRKEQPSLFKGLRRVGVGLRKSWSEGRHPRHPSGDSDGGRFASADRWVPFAGQHLATLAKDAAGLPVEPVAGVAVTGLSRLGDSAQRIAKVLQRIPAEDRDGATLHVARAADMQVRGVYFAGHDLMALSDALAGSGSLERVTAHEFGHRRLRRLAAAGIDASEKAREVIALAAKTPSAVHGLVYAMIGRAVERGMAMAEAGQITKDQVLAVSARELFAECYAYIHAGSGYAGAVRAAQAIVEGGEDEEALAKAIRYSDDGSASRSGRRRHDGSAILGCPDRANRSTGKVAGAPGRPGGREGCGGDSGNVKVSSVEERAEELFDEPDDITKSVRGAEWGRRDPRRISDAKAAHPVATGSGATPKEQKRTNNTQCEARPTARKSLSRIGLRVRQHAVPLAKSQVKGHWRINAAGRMEYVKPYSDKRTKKQQAQAAPQSGLFGAPVAAPAKSKLQTSIPVNEPPKAQAATPDSGIPKRVSLPSHIAETASGKRLSGALSGVAAALDAGYSATGSEHIHAALELLSDMHESLSFPDYKRVHTYLEDADDYLAALAEGGGKPADNVSPGSAQAPSPTPAARRALFVRFAKSHVRAHTRMVGGKLVQVRAHEDKRQATGKTRGMTTPHVSHPAADQRPFELTYEEWLDAGKPGDGDYRGVKDAPPKLGRYLQIVKRALLDGDDVPARVIEAQPALRRIHIERSDAFQQEFDGSVVVDDDGRPRLVYSGRKADDSGRSAYFASNPTVAKAFAATMLSTRSKIKDPKVSESWLVIKNPLIFQFDRQRPFSLGWERPKELEEAELKFHRGELPNDGIIIRRVYEAGFLTDVFIVADQKQVIRFSEFAADGGYPSPT